MLHITLFVAGDAPRSHAARQVLDEIVTAGDGRPNYEVIDVLREPARALEVGLIATPTLILEHNGKQRRYVGELRNREELQHTLMTFGRDENSKGANS